ncbi:hypothetical protein Lalb_Chr07g0191061 [Lupinus albus]|uniref:Uncharacterized protein n=1 Tax=Lupinus albus TaxID=3870 RepID=A0A6A4QA80_LUPAL|nr:hypothetical protein Lalb_Chr07g0191061 [Lupinus albus]
MPIEGGCKCKKDPYYSQLDNWTECIQVVNALCLCVALGHQSIFVSFNRAISFMLDFIYPFAVFCLLI